MDQSSTFRPPLLSTPITILVGIWVPPIFWRCHRTFTTFASQSLIGIILLLLASGRVVPLLLTMSCRRQAHMRGLLTRLGQTTLVVWFSPRAGVAMLLDPSTWILSEPMQWDNLVPLISYIHSLHDPKLKLQDTTITLANPGIHDNTFNINDTFEIIHVGRPHSRMTTVFGVFKLGLPSMVL